MSYRSLADLGATPNAGVVRPEPEGELFHAAWEPRVLAMTLAVGATGAWNIDMSRSARETLPDYAALSYYQVWFAGLVKLLAERGLVAADELATGHALHPPQPLPRTLAAADVPAVLARGAPTLRSAPGVARFAIGDRVRTRADAAAHHTRLPGYARGRVGRIERLHGAHVFADAHAQGLGEQPQWLYTVVFASRATQPSGTGGDFTVSIDAWEPYLERVANDEEPRP